MHPGQVIQDRYLLEERLGGGGMGQVWRALDQRLQRVVAIKLIAPQFVDEPEFLVRFLREAQSIARITHPNVVSILDFGEAEERPFLVMEHVPGRPLSDVTGSPMDPDRARTIIGHAAGAAGAAHAQGIVHRDIKPANILITDDGRTKLVDFGIASLENVDRITATGMTIGSPHYISPEQASGEKATSRSDVYALGVVLFELLTGRRPFEGDSVAAVALAQVEESPPAPSALVSDLDRDLEQIVLKCLAKSPSARFADGNELAQALTGADASRTSVMAAAGAGAAAGSTQVLSVDDALPYEEDPFEGEEEGDSPWKAALIGLLIGLVLLAVAAGAYALLSADDEPRVPAAPRETPERETASPSPEDSETAPEVVEDESVEPSAPVDEDGTEGSDEEEEDEPTDDEEEDDETVEGGIEVEAPSNGQGPDGEGPPGQEKKD